MTTQDALSQKEGSDAPLVVAVVLTWNDKELTRGCLRSVFANDFDHLKVVLVDNGSEPPVGPGLSAEFPDLQLVQNEMNQGFSGGANRGLEAALEMGADYVHLIGNDATLAPDCIRLLLEECEQNTQVGVAAPVLLDPGDEEVVQFYTASLDRDQASHHHHRVGEPYVRGEWPTVESEFIPCVAPFFRATMLREVGLFDESFGTCWEDFDLCIRIHDAGWSYFTVGAATAVHIGSYTTGRVSTYITYYTTRNRLICLKRYSRDLASPARMVRLIRSFWWQMRGFGIANWACQKAFLKGFYDFFMAQHGESRDTSKGEIPGVGR